MAISHWRVLFKKAHIKKKNRVCCQMALKFLIFTEKYREDFTVDINIILIVLFVLIFNIPHRKSLVASSIKVVNFPPMTFLIRITTIGFMFF